MSTTDCLSHGPLTPALRGLAGAWRSRAEELRVWGASGNADTLSRAADELEAALWAEGEEVLSLPEASEVSGYSADHLARLIRQGKLPNAGRPNAPRLRRADIPKKAGTLPTPLRTVISKAQIARSVVTSYKARP